MIKLNQVGLVGWRGMVGSVLLQRMRCEDDFALMKRARFFSTSQAGQPPPDIGADDAPQQDARDLDALGDNDVIITCQGGEYTADMHPRLRARGWDGYWIDAASTLRMHDDAMIILDPVNRALIARRIEAGCKDFIGGNCTVSLMMMALAGLLNDNLIEAVSVATYQAVSGGGARQARELLAQMHALHQAAAPLLDDAHGSILPIDDAVTRAMRADELPRDAIGNVLAGSLLPWIDRDLDDGNSREEWKGAAEANKILARIDAPIAIDSTCVRVGVMRCHSQAMTIRLAADLSLDEIGAIIARGHQWVKLIDNRRETSLAQLTPAAVSGTLDIAVGRLRKLSFGANIISAFTVGDQLLWGAAEPLRRMLRILAEAE